MKIVRSYFSAMLAAKQMRENRTISLREVERSTGVGLNFLSLMARDKVKRVDLDDLAKLCDYLECTPGDILRIEERQP